MDITPHYGAIRSLFITTDYKYFDSDNSDDAVFSWAFADNNGDNDSGLEGSWVTMTQDSMSVDLSGTPREKLVLKFKFDCPNGVNYCRRISIAHTACFKETFNTDYLGQPYFLHETKNFSTNCADYDSSDP